MRKRLIIILLSLYPLTGIGQNSPAFRQFYFNPYLFNPAFAGTNDYTSISLLYRQQWVGFNNAPSVAGFTIQYPTQNRVSVGMNFLSQESVALRTTSTQATFAYRIPITAKQFLFFGLSGVAGYNDLNLEGADYSNDPTILNAASTRFYSDANFGLVYQLSNLRVGFALPKLLGQDYYSPNDLVNGRNTQLRNQLYSASYKFYSGNFSFEPYALYRVNRDFQNWWEATTVISFKEKIWTGVSYHSTQGLGFFLGVEFNEKVRFSYSYEIPLASSEFISTSSHEVHLQLRLGKKRKFKWAARFAEPGAETQHPVVEETPVNKEVDTAAKDVVKQEEAVLPPEKKEEVKAVEKTNVNAPIVSRSRPPEQPTLAQGLYVIAGSFQTLEYASAYQRRLVALGYGGVKAGMNPKNKIFYVYLFASYDLDECRKVRDQFRLKTATKDAWILKIE